jgi:hypothetical protein
MHETSHRQDEPMSFTFSCPECDGSAMIQFEHWLHEGPAEEAAWACPWCRAVHRIGAIGRIAWAVKGPVPPAAVRGER